MMSRKRFLLGLLCLSIFFGSASTSQAKSVYAIIKHSDSTIAAYDIQGDQIEYQTDTQLDFGSGAVSLALDPNSATLFTTYDGANYIGLINAKTMIAEDDTVSAPSELAGMAFGEVDSNQRLLAVGRETTKLFVYIYNSSSKTLTLDGGVHKTLNGLGDNGAFGIALDEQEQILYVTDKTNKVKCYDATGDFAYVEDVTIEVDGQDRPAVGIAVYNDGQGNRYLYTGAWSHNVSHNYLVRTYLNAPNAIFGQVEKYLGTNATSIAVDQATGLVYVTTSNGHIEVFDNATFPSDPIYVEDSDRISHPADICIAGDVGFLPPFEPSKTDNIEDCVPPRDGQITYNINYDYQWDEESDPAPADFDSIIIVDELPMGVDFMSATPSGTVGDGTVIWSIDPNLWAGPGNVELVVQTNKVTPGGMIENNVEIIATIGVNEYVGKFTLQTPVCDCTGYGKIIYVDIDATEGNNDGSTWLDAYTSLQSALAESWPCDEVWVAEGTYRLTSDPNNPRATFRLVSGVGVYGGFVGGQSGEEHRYERNWFDNETILSGIIDSYDNEPNRVDYVVVSDVAGSVSVLDGFIITGGGIAGVYCESSSLLIQHNKITDSDTGIYCFESAQPVIKNNWFYKNENGIYLDNPEDTAVVRNNTIAYNANVGVYQHVGTYADISNCIIWGNEGGQLDLDDRYMPTYSCIQDSSEVNPYHNINTDPCFAYDDPNDYHLVPDSPCIDAGDPAGDYTGDRDIDKHFRVLDGDGDDGKRVDMGADEYCNQGADNAADFNEDDIVDTADLIEMVELWLTDPGPSSKYDLYPDNTIDYIDFAYFAKEWFWMTCEMMQGYAMMEMMMGASGESMPALSGVEGLMAEDELLSPTTQKEESSLPAEPSVEGQIEQIKSLLDWLYEIAGEVDEETWLSLTTTLEEMLKELEAD